MSQIKRVVKLHNGILSNTPSNLSLHQKNNLNKTTRDPPPQ